MIRRRQVSGGFFIFPVIPREGGVSSTPRPSELIIDVTAYWIIRRSLSSGGHSADPVADDDGR